MEPTIVSQRPITLAELKQEVTKLKGREKEPSMRIVRMDEYLSLFSESKSEKAKELYDAITKLNINRLKEEHICKIVDMVPKTLDELKLIMQGYALSLTNDASKKIVDAVNGHVGKK
jgi:DNA-directed RNA polymerase subunit F